MKLIDFVVLVCWIIIKYNEIKEVMKCYRNIKEKKLKFFKCRINNFYFVIMF